MLDQAERWQELINLWPDYPVQAFSAPAGLPAQLESLQAVDNLADQVRQLWGLGSSPIPDLIDVLETHGILVIITQVDAQAKFDGLQASVAGQPVIVVSADWPGTGSVSPWPTSSAIC